MANEVRSGQFALFIFAIAAIARHIPFPRYDLMLALCLGFQAWMVATRRETWSEFGCIAIFHFLGLCLEMYKVRHGSWAYPEFAYTKINGVPAFSGFMYASVASYVFQAKRNLNLEFQNWPKWPWLILGCGAIYANFFLSRRFGDVRWPIAAVIVAIYARSWVSFTTVPTKRRRMPLLLAFVGIGFFVWMGEHVCTFLGIWQYPEQSDGWTWVSAAKWSSWTLLTVVSVSIATEWMRRFNGQTRQSAPVE